MSDQPPDPLFPDDAVSGADTVPAPRPWIVLQNAHEVETWIETYNRELQAVVWRNKLNTANAGQGICFALELGGEIYLHTTTEGQVLLDVSEEASWVNPVISAATGAASPAGTVWVLPQDTLTQLILGLSGMIATSQFVLRHEYRIGKSQRIRF
ncbi:MULTISPECIES: hypothetical protein [unclassified Herbaspirillum]|uniref:hypothetical protein n=1 Tax=unclassified Herbaspirillum TaxID=2624150 RepID=UPI00115023DB|nr:MULTISPECIES: hypothetical protein [unclassified Herbaspirillum]MBB5391689.1 hypothetical protein [Herbaspirillum sp. SJZ102]TQK03064.1 hypothetical protein FB599_3734 [Herbaspirillum sp. SJZ130]TQK06548.1 hypothetical protein FB598_3551 [Herbaspirillum sp. SJZ106]